MTRTKLLATVLAVAALGPASAQRRVAAAPAAASGDHRGVYVASGPLLNARRSIPDEVYREPAASGVYIRLAWSQVERERGRYDLSLLDAELRRAVAAGRKVAISIMGGGRSPRWLRDAGVRVLDFRVRRGGRNGGCIPVAVPLPWEPGYQRAYAGVLRAVADRVRATPGGWNALRVVKIAGIARITEELRVPITVGPGECDADPNAEWARAGYTPDRAVEAWSALADATARAFPGKVLGQDVLDRNDFPRADGRGWDPSVKERIIDQGLRRYPGRFMVQWNALNIGGKVAQTPLRAQARGALLGWQTNAYQGLEGAGCNERRRGVPAPCDAPGYDRILQGGVRTGATYIEIWPDDALRFPQAVRAADEALRRNR